MDAKNAFAPKPIGVTYAERQSIAGGIYPKEASAEMLRLHMGELTANELRVARAAYRLGAYHALKQSTETNVT